MAKDAGLSVLSVTDHDTTEGVAEALAAAERQGITLIPGVELNSRTAHGEAHVLGYFVRHDDPTLRRRLAERREARDARGEAMVARLAEIGLHLSWERVLQLADGGSVGRPHVARALVEAGYVADLDSAFREYIGKGAPGYLPTPYLMAPEAVQWVLEAGGVPVLAHPIMVLQALPTLIAAGLEGLEVYYGAYTPADVQALAAVAKRHGLLATGGTDFHGHEVMPTCPLGGAPLPWENVEQLLAHPKARVLRPSPSP